jgi:hypothetical protein
MRPLLNRGTLGGRLNVRRDLDQHGFDIVPDAVPEASRERLLRLLEPSRLPRSATHPSGLVFAARHLLESIPELGPELKAAGLGVLAATYLGPDAFPIDAAFFDKQAAANWTVPVHQDRVLPVHVDDGRRHRVTSGIAVAEPSPSTLARLLALRIHFDVTDAETGALHVLPGSHVRGVLTDEEVRAVPLSSFVPCSAAVGDVLLMRPLLLHRSPPSLRDGQRRVLHVVYATNQPDGGLRWRASAQKAVAADGRTSS